MLRKIALMVFAGFGVASCGSSIQTADFSPSESRPDYKTVVARQLEFDEKNSALTKLGKDNNRKRQGTEMEPVFANPDKLDGIEISDARPVRHPKKGWTWQTCLRVYQQGWPVDYTVFIIDQFIVDARTSVAIDECAEQRFEPLRWSPHKKYIH